MNFLHKLVEANIKAIRQKIILIWVAVITLALTSCLPGAPANEYDLVGSVKENKFPSSELDRIVYDVQKSVEQKYRQALDTEWQAYWKNAEMFALCGEIEVNNQQEGETAIPIEPINLEDIVKIEAWIEYHSFTPSQFFDNLPDSPIAKTIRAVVAYRNERWEVKSVDETKDSLCSYCSCFKCLYDQCLYPIKR